MTVTMLPSAGEYANHKGERFETDGTVYNVCGTECCLLMGYGLFAIDQLEVVDDGTGGLATTLNERLRALVDELWSLAYGYVPMESELDDARDMMRELGIEVS